MANVIAVLSAIVAAAGAVVAWYFNYELKKYEIAQTQSTKVLDKRFECYPRIWEACQPLLDKLNTFDKSDLDSFGACLWGLYQKDGLYYSKEVHDKIVKGIDFGNVSGEVDLVVRKHLEEWINGRAEKGIKGILDAIRDDLGGYVVPAAHTLG